MEILWLLLFLQILKHQSFYFVQINFLQYSKQSERVPTL